MSEPAAYNEELGACLHEPKKGMPCRYRHDGSYKTSRGAFLPRGGGKIGIAEEEGGGGGIGEKKGGWARGRGDTRTGEETRARAPWRGGANQASDRHQFGGDHAESRGGGFGLGTRPGSGADPSRVGGCVRQVLHPAGA